MKIINKFFNGAVRLLPLLASPNLTYCFKIVDELPARKLYEHVFPEIISRLTGPGDATTPYWPGSPYGGKEWFETADLTTGDVHEWHIWCGISPGEYYQNYDILGGRFIRQVTSPHPFLSLANE